FAGCYSRGSDLVVKLNIDMKKIGLFFICLLAFQNSFAQERVITTAVPFLLIPADARAAGMGDVGVATTADAFSQQYNPAKYAFSLDEQGVFISYTPYLTEIVNDINLGQFGYYYRLNGLRAAAPTLRFLGLRVIVLTEGPTDPVRTISPSELAIYPSYSLRLSETYSMDVCVRYIRSRLRLPDCYSV